MSLTSWHPPPITPIGFSSHTSNGDYGRWSHLADNHYSPITFTTPSFPWLQRKSSFENHNSDTFSSNGILSSGRKTDTASNVTNITFTEKNSYPFASEVRKSLLSGNNYKNDSKAVLYTNTDPTPNNTNKLAASAYTTELYNTHESSPPSFKTNFTTTVNSNVSPWNQNNYSTYSLESQKEPRNLSRRAAEPSTPGLTATSHIKDPSTTRGYELYSYTNGRPTTTASSNLHSTPSTSITQSLQRSNSFHGPATIHSPIVQYNAVSSKTVKDKLENWTNDRQNASSANSVVPYILKDSHVNSAGKEPSYSFTACQNHELSNGSHTSSRLDLYGGTKPYTYESYNHGLGLSRPNSGISNGCGTLEKSTENLQHKLDELNMGNSALSTASSLETKLRTPESPRSLLVPLSPRNSRTQTDWDRYLNGDRSTTSPSSSETMGKPRSNKYNSVDQRFWSATAGKPKSILKKKSAYETVSGIENCKSYFQDTEFTGYGLYRQNTMPVMKQSSRAPLPQLARKSTGRRVHFAI